MSPFYWGMVIGVWIGALVGLFIAGVLMSTRAKKMSADVDRPDGLIKTKEEKKMEKTKHTPGPWKSECMGSEGYVVWMDGPISKEHHSLSRIADCTKMPFYISKANARLIAAAPELLEAAVDMVGLWEAWAHIAEALIGSPLWRSIEMRIEEFRMAIAKAKGD